MHSGSDTQDQVRRVKQAKQWCIYLLECSDKTIYCGITNDLEKRIAKHNTGDGAKYTRARLPVRLLKSFNVETKSEALKEEYRIKQLSREEKLKLCKTI